MDLLTDCFNESLDRDEKYMKERVEEMEPFQAIPTPVTEFIFLTCNSLHQPDEVRHLSVELFDRFIRLHFKDLMEKVWNKDKRIAKKEWKIVKEKLRVQSSLRMLSCIQLASKFVLHSKSLRAVEIQRHLNSDDTFYPLTAINASEIRVWKTLHFKLYIPTVLTYVNLIIEQIKYTITFPRSHSEITKTAYFLTDYVYLHHEEIFHNLFRLSTGRWEATNEEKEEFLKIKCNTSYKAAAIMALAMTFIKTTSEDTIFEEIGSLSKIPPNDIKALAKTINKVVFN